MSNIVQDVFNLADFDRNHNWPASQHHSRSDDAMVLLAVEAVGRIDVDWQLIVVLHPSACRRSAEPALLVSCVTDTKLKRYSKIPTLYMSVNTLKPTCGSIQTYFNCGSALQNQLSEY